MISSISTQSMSMLRTSGSQTAQLPVDVNETSQSKVAAGTKGAEGRPPATARRWCNGRKSR